MKSKIKAIRFIAIGLFVLSNLSGASGQSKEFETRCGWLSNPTPGNYSLYDKDGEWIIGVQGGYQVEDFEMPIFKRGQWIVTNTADYGHGCACLEMRTDEESSRVLEIKKSFARPLAACRKDKTLRKWKNLF